MNDAPGRGSYPPAQIWRFPPTPVSRGWLVAAIAAGVIGLVGFGGAATYFAMNGERDLPGFIDDEQVIKVAKSECRLMIATVEGTPVGGGPDERLSALADQNAAVTTMVERIRSLEPEIRRSDKPLDAWLADWEALVSGRETYLDRERRGGSSTFTLPKTADGDPITDRMNQAGADVCKVPKVLLRPDLAGARPI